LKDLGFIHRFVPASDPENRLVLLMLHGTGGNEDDLLPLGHELAPGAALLSPRGKVLERGMPRFFRRFAEGHFDVADVKYRAGELAKFLDDAAEQYGLEDKRTIAVGYSNGANIAAAMMLLHPDRLFGGALLRAMTPFQPERIPNLQGRRVLLCAGQRDQIVPGASAIELAEMLKAGGADVTLHWHPGGHELAGTDIDATKAWLSTVALSAGGSD
jgi:predicted esterase